MCLNQDNSNQKADIEKEHVSHNRIHWHEAFYEALQLELDRYLEFLQFENERLLSKEALKMDVLIIKKEKDIEIEKNIGRIFKIHNIFEYKSETDYLSIHDYNKVLGYALLYSSFERISTSDVTVSFVISRYPRELLKYLEGERKLRIDNVEDGVYYVVGDVVSVQILEQKKLSYENNLFLSSLSSNVDLENAVNILNVCENIENLNIKNKYLETVMLANIEVFMEAMRMSTTFLEEAMKRSPAFQEFLLETAEKNGWLKESSVYNEELAKQVYGEELLEGRNIELAKKMLQDGESIEKIIRYAELPLETIRKLQQQV